MSGSPEPDSLSQVLERIGAAEASCGRVKLDAIVGSVGRRSFGPLLLMAGLVTASPLSGIPGMPSLMGLLVMLVSVQMLMRRAGFWLPRWMLERSVSLARRDKAVALLRRPAAFLDRFVRPSWVVMVDGPGSYLVAATCTVIAASMIPLEMVPFAATGAGVALAVFGLALTAHDGRLAALGFAITVAVFAAATWGVAGRSLPG